MKRVMDHYDDGVMENCDDSYHGEFGRKAYWSIVRKCFMDHCDDKGHGAL